MKISYERLNQIIEEEVVRFKKLNEDLTNQELSDPVKVKEAIKTLLDTKSAPELASLYKQLGGKIRT